MRDVLLVASLLSMLGGCASPVDVRFDPRVDFTRYRTWDWIPGPAGRLDPSGGSPHHLGRRLMRCVERELASRGLARDPEHAELLVGARLRVQRKLMVVRETSAVQHVASMHDSASYDVQATRTRLQPYESGRLEIDLATPRGMRVIWRGVLEREVRGEIASHLEELVARLLESFPPPVPARTAPTPPSPAPGLASASAGPPPGPDPRWRVPQPAWEEVSVAR